ncbi:MAG TPA: hypothetical protein VNU19_07065 [Candidatus Acidoferrum sp.]|jgi:hypothetical protein|nr:hypothetical protein [Candidatus Acidoferrum sp.]
MAEYTTEYDIANRALVHCGISPNIGTSFVGSKNAVVMGFLYDKIRVAALREHIWKFAVVFENLTLNGTAFYQGDVTRNIFGYPTGYIRPANQDPRTQGSLYQRTSGGIQYSDFDFVQAGIITEASSVGFWYVQDTSTVTIFDPMFCEAVAAQLAMAAVPVLTQSPQKLQQIEPIYQGILQRAIAVDAIEVGNMEPVGDKLRTERVNISLMPAQPPQGAQRRG